jgi:trans-aconitate 2-methyltransferase
MSWDPNQYAKFTDLRLRPALDLINRVPLDAPARIVDLGCGTGNVTARLAERWSGATVIGVDSSQEMLKVAREKYRAIAWQEADLSNWEAERPVELVYSNAALHWIGEHAQLFPRLIEQVLPGGVLAVQMPRNFAAPSHAICAELASSARWRSKLGQLVKPAPVAEPGVYYDLLRPRTSALEIWETEYVQPLEGERPVLEWIKGSWLRPFLGQLSADEALAFEDSYAERVAIAYPRRADGITLLPFRRLFIIGRR